MREDWTARGLTHCWWEFKLAHPWKNDLALQGKAQYS